MNFSYLFVLFSILLIGGQQVKAGMLSAAIVGAAIAIDNNLESTKQQRSDTVLHVQLVSASNLLGKDHHVTSSATSDPFVYITQDHLQARSTTIKKNLNPVWPKDQAWAFGIVDFNKELEIQVYSDHRFPAEGCGSAKLNLATIAHTPTTYHIPLKGDAGLKTNPGSVELVMWIAHK